eukprot:m.457307 g.457307  ORF g.457307 m.457307 type:complete len:741 (+) comp21234_c0_seq1:279-2501(+)
MPRGQRRRRLAECESRQAFDDAERWAGLGEERGLEIARLAAGLKQAAGQRVAQRHGRSDNGAASAAAPRGGGSAVSTLWFSRRSGATRLTFTGAEAVEWLVHTTKTTREDAMFVAGLMLAGNLIRCLSDRPHFEDTRNSQYCFVADDPPEDGPSVASTVPHAVLDGWLALSFGARCDVYGRVHNRKPPRYCVLKRHGLSYVLYYYSTDHGARPLGFINLKKSDACQYISHHCPNPTRLPTPSFRLRASAVDGSNLELTATAPCQVQAERWIRAFAVVVGANYVEQIPPTLPAAPDEASLHSFCITGARCGTSNSDRSYRDFAGQAVLVVNVDVTNPHASAQFSQLQFLHDEFALRKTDRIGGLVLVVYPCDQFDATEELTIDVIRDRIAGFGATLESFIVAGKVSVNGIGTVGSNHADSKTPRVPPEWAFLKARRFGDRGSYVTWSFTKFLVDGSGTPIRRFEPGASLNELRRGVAEVLLSSGQPENIDGKRDGPLLLEMDNSLNISRRIYEDGDFAELTSAWPDLGPYYTIRGDGPFPRGPVTFPSRRLKHTVAPTPRIIRVRDRLISKDSDAESEGGGSHDDVEIHADSNLVLRDGADSVGSEGVDAGIPALFQALLRRCTPTATALTFEPDVAWFDPGSLHVVTEDEMEGRNGNSVIAVESAVDSVAPRPPGLLSRRVTSPHAPRLSLTSVAGADSSYHSLQSTLSLPAVKVDNSVGSDASSDVEQPSPRATSHTLL